MKHSKRTWIRFTALCLVPMLLSSLLILFSYKANTVEAAVYGNASVYVTDLSGSLNVRNKPTTSGSTIIAKLYRGTRVNIISETTDASGTKWAYVDFLLQGVPMNGYCSSQYLERDITVDEAFENAIAAFPESYRPYLRALHAKHPNWIFRPIEVDATWQETLEKETQFGWSLIQNSVADPWKAHDARSYNASTGKYTIVDGSTWVNAAPEVVAYYLDPRNSLYETTVFQYMNLTYNPEVQTIDTVIPLMKGFMGRGETFPNPDGTLITYAEAFMAAAAYSGANPLFLASKVLQEIGYEKSGSVTGGYAGYEGYYNFYNIGASSGSDPVANGLRYAKTIPDNAEEASFLLPWNTVYSAIVGGARWITSRYISCGQDSLYLMKFNVKPGSSWTFCTHQYMTNIRALDNEAKEMYVGYRDNGVLEQSFVFEIPVYQNMTASACEMPPTTGAGDFLTNTFNAILGRTPDTETYRCYTANLTSSTTYAGNVILELLTSYEYYLSNYSTEQFIDKLYMAALGRAPDEAGKQSYINEINTGTPRTEIIIRIINSAESRNYVKRYGLPSIPYVPTPTMITREYKAAFVHRMYNECLSRLTDGDGFVNWLRALEAGMSGADIAAGFIFSAETGLRNLSDEDFVKMLYRTMFGRDADQAGLNHWVEYLRFGMTRDEVFGEFVRSDEYRDMCNLYSVNRGNYVVKDRSGYISGIDTAQVEAFVSRMYSVVLGREPEAEGKMNWSRWICTGVNTGASCAHGFIFSSEYTSKNTSNADYVTMLYIAILDRAPDEPGLEHWVSMLEGGTSREEILRGFVISNEYRGICERYGIPFGNVSF